MPIVRPKPEEKRRLKRHSSIYYLEVFDQDTGKLLGRMVDMTTEGFMLIHEASLPVDAVFNCRMALPAELLGRTEIFFEGACRWCRRAVNGDLYEAGFRLEKVDPDDVEVIEMLIRHFAFND